MDRQRVDPTHALTPLVYSCPACHTRTRLLIAWPIWECPSCHERLIPADLYPVSEEGEPVQPPAQQPPASNANPAPMNVRQD